MNQFQIQTYIKKEERKNILLLSDDLRMSSGVGVMSKEFVLGTSHRYNWFQVGAAIKHPEKGKLTDISQLVKKETGIPDPYVRVLPNDGYGDPQLIRNLIQNEKIDAILHFTDPRFWIWLYQIEHEIRQQVPILFYHIWDNTPYPMYNKMYYMSCDYIACISKQTENIVKSVTANEQMDDWQVDYIPHGINKEQYYPITEDNQEQIKKMFELKKRIFGENDYKFILFYNSRNIRRKMTSNIILSFKLFRDSLPPEDRNKVAILLHTAPVDENGTDLPAVVQAIAPDIKIYFSAGKLSTEDLNILYNISDATICMSNAEGWGLSATESLMAGTPIIATVTGGLQDQMRFVDENGKLVKFDYNWGTNADGRYKKCGEWVIPLFPDVRSITGSPLTPYIYEDFVDPIRASTKIKEIYDMGREERKSRGLKGREWAISDESGMHSDEMSKRFVQGIDKALKNWTPRKRFKLYKV